jgi:hypothetical protein
MSHSFLSHELTLKLGVVNIGSLLWRLSILRGLVERKRLM